MPYPKPTRIHPGIISHSIGAIQINNNPNAIDSRLYAFVRPFSRATILSGKTRSSDGQKEKRNHQSGITAGKVMLFH